MPKPSRLEQQLEGLTREFVSKIVAAIRTATFAEVAGFLPTGVAPAGAQAGTRPVAARSTASVTRARPRQTAETRAELADRVADMLSHAASPMGVRAIASELGVLSDLLTVPLRELRAAGRIAKHGDKRATTYSAP